MVKISENAARKMMASKLEEGVSNDAVLRVSVRKGGCSGLTYDLKFAETPENGDKIFESAGQKIAVDNGSLLYLAGMTLDYSGGLNGKGFVFDNPNASKKCGCGTSFNISGAPTPEKPECR